MTGDYLSKLQGLSSTWDLRSQVPPGHFNLAIRLFAQGSLTTTSDILPRRLGSTPSKSLAHQQHLRQPNIANTPKYVAIIMG